MSNRPLFRGKRLPLHRNVREGVRQPEGSLGHNRGINNPNNTAKSSDFSSDPDWVNTQSQLSTREGFPIENLGNRRSSADYVSGYQAVREDIHTDRSHLGRGRGGHNIERSGQYQQRGGRRGVQRSSRQDQGSSGQHQGSSRQHHRRNRSQAHGVEAQDRGSRNIPQHTFEETQTCHYCGSDIARGREVFDQHKEYHQECLSLHKPRFAEAVKEFRKTVLKKNVLSIAISVEYLYGCKNEDKKRKRTKRDIKVNELLDLVSAIRNSGSGFLLIHLVGLDPEDNFTGAFDEFADVKLHGLINDGSLFTDVFKKQLLSDRKKFSEFTDILVLYVEGADHLITSDFKTKLTLDECILDTPDLTLLKFIQKRIEFEGQFHEINAQNAAKLIIQQESRHIQTKAFFQPKTRDEDVVTSLFDQLNVAEYISAFSKNENGGSYLLGLSELKREFEKYHSKVFKVKPVEIDDCEKVERLIIERVSQTCLVCDYDGKEQSKDIVKVSFIPTGQDPSTDNTGFVVHISVRSVNGIVFYDKNGPVACRIDPLTNSTKRLTVSEWYKAFKERLDQGR